MKVVLSILLLIAAPGLWSNIPGVEAAVSCEEGTYEALVGLDSYCRDTVGAGSYCTETKVCSNPYHSGCLQRKLGSNADNANSKRACNSDDPANAMELGLCETSPFNYTEIRIHNSNWESSIFYAWALQILLSERLQVPVTIGLGPDTNANSFYDIDNRFSYSPLAYSYEAMEEANRMRGGDCRLSDIECFHVMPEVWNGQVKEYTAAMESETVDPVEGDGQVGKISWYIPAFTASRHPEMTSFYGLRGDANRPKLAELFKRPTKWKDYCDLVSPDKCATPDGFAARYPTVKAEEDTYFAGEGSYIGHFRATDANNCTLNPTTCTGHIVAPPCTWSSFIDSQIYWNDIAVESSGDDEPNGSYSYGEMTKVWKAANATKSHIMMWWFTPDATVELYRGGDFEFQPILLPGPTATCRDKRISADARCSLDVEERQGEADGSCDSEAHSLQKIIASSLRKSTNDVAIAERSPGYTTVRNFKISDLDMEAILKVWITHGQDPDGFDGREAVCSWVADNLDALDTFIPVGYPRILSEDSQQYDGPFLIAAQSVGAFSVFLVCLAALFVYHRRLTRVFVFAQVNFVLNLIGGLFFIAWGAIVYGLTPDNATCVVRQWLVTLGYTTEIVPLLVKLSAINRVLHSAKRLKRVQISVQSMFLTVAALILFAAIFLTIWTILDPPHPVEDLILVEEEGNLVESSLSCESDSGVWMAAAIAWEAILLVMATVLAFQTRNVSQEFNESRSMGTMIYSHFLFMILRVIVGLLEANGTFPADWAAGATSFLLSLDVIFAICIYIVPKTIAASKNPEIFKRGSTSSITTDHDRAKPLTSKRPTIKKPCHGTMEGPTKSVLADLSMFSVDEASDEDGFSSSHLSGEYLIDAMNRVSVVETSEDDEETDDSPPSPDNSASARNKMREIEGEFKMFKEASGDDFNATSENSDKETMEALKDW